MKREATTLGELKYGDVFYFASDRKKVTYQCRSWNRPNFRYGYKNWTRNYLDTAGGTAKRGWLESASGHKQVIKISKTN